jgi:hypothetical protein
MGRCHVGAWRRGELTTNQGVPVADNQNSLKAGCAARRCSRTSSSARRSPTSTTSASPSASCTRAARRARLLRVLRAARRVTRASLFSEAGKRRRCSCASRPCRRARLDRHRARRARLRGEVLHRRRQLGPGRQQHPGVLHPGRDEVPRPGPRGEARAAPRDAAGGERARHVLGLRLADARDHPHADVGDVGPRDPAQLPHDAGLRRAHLPPGQRAGESRFVKFHWKPRSARTRWCGTRRSRSPAPIPTSTAATCGRRSRPAPIPSGSSACRSSPRSRPSVQLRRARRDQDRARGAGAGAPGRPAGAQPQPRQLLRRDRAGRVLHRARRARHRLHERSAAAGRIHSYVDTQISRLGGPNFHEIPINAPIAQVHNNQRDGMHRRRSIAAASPTSRTRSAAAVRSRPARRASCRSRSR